MQKNQKNLKQLQEDFKEIQLLFDKLLFQCETFDDATFVLQMRHEKESALLDKFRLVNDLAILDQLEIDFPPPSAPSIKEAQK